VQTTKSSYTPEEKGKEMFKVPDSRVIEVSVVSMPEHSQAGEETKDTEVKPVTKMEEIVARWSY
jgi:hypothetical protein